MIVQWAELMDLRPSQAATAPVMIAAKLTLKPRPRPKLSWKDANLQEDMELHGMVSCMKRPTMACLQGSGSGLQSACEAGRNAG